MKKETFSKIERYIPVALTGVFLWIYYLCNVKLGVYAQDDILYSTNLVTGEPLRNLADIIESQVWHYFNWGGRSIAHTILQLTFLAGDTFINIFNPLACLAFSAVCCLFVKKRTFWTLLGFLSAIFALNTIWYETELWQTGIANYLYLAVFYLPLLYLYIKELEEPAEKSPWYMIPAAAVLGLISGWSNENVGPALFAGFVLCIAAKIIKKQGVPPWMIVGAVTTFIGLTVMIAAPGNYVRADEAAAQGGADGIMGIVNRVYMVFMAFFVYAFYPACFCIGASLVKFGRQGAKWAWKDTVLMLVTVATMGAMVMSPHYPNRAIFATTVLFIVTGMKWLDEARERVPALYGRIGIVILWAAGIFRMLIYYFE